MNRALQLVIGVGATLSFGAMGGWILWWAVATSWTARAALDWPTVRGEVVSSQLVYGGDHSEPEVRYRYVVEGETYTSDQLGFAPFREKGGRGTARSRVARYPKGTEVEVYVDPRDPSVSVLEPGGLGPMLMPAMFGVLFLGGSGLMAWRTIQYARGQDLARRPPLPREQRVRIAGTLTSVMLFCVLLIVSVDSSVQEIQVDALSGLVSADLAPTVFLVVQLLLFLPVPWFVHHGSHVVVSQLERGGDPGLPGVVGAVLREGAGDGERGRSAKIAGLGLVFVFAVMLGWIAFAAVRGV